MIWQSFQEHPKTRTKMDCILGNDRLFIGNYATGIVYSDRRTEEHGDYKRLAFLSYRTLELEINRDCPQGLRKMIERHATRIQSMKGQQYQISTSGQTITLGEEK